MTEMNLVVAHLLIDPAQHLKPWFGEIEIDIGK